MNAILTLAEVLTTLFLMALLAGEALHQAIAFKKVDNRRLDSIERRRRQRSQLRNVR